MQVSARTLVYHVQAPEFNPQHIGRKGDRERERKKKNEKRQRINQFIDAKKAMFLLMTYNTRKLPSTSLTVPDSMTS